MAVGRSFTAVEYAAFASAALLLLVILVPSCMRALHFARTAEAAQTLEVLRARILEKQDPRLPAAPLTPAVVPRGEAVVDPEGTWNHPTWSRLEFAVDDAHWFSYALDARREGDVVEYVGRAHGDLDGDGVLSTFVVRVRSAHGRLESVPGLEVTAELE